MSFNMKKEQVPHALEQVGRLAGAAVKNVSLDPALALGQEGPERRCSLG
jgi:hypothetical protein